MNRQQRRAARSDTRPAPRGLQARAADLHIRAVAAYQSGQFALSVELFAAAIAANPNAAAYHSNLANPLRELGRLEEAAASLQRALILQPGFADALNNLGVVHELRLRPADAALCYQKAIAANPQLASAHSNLGNALQKLGHPEDAIACYQKALALHPDFADAHFNLGNVLAECGRLQPAIDCFDTAARLNPGNADAHFNMGNTLGRLGRLAEAAACLRRATGCRPDFSSAHNNLAMALLAQGDFAQGWREYEWRWHMPTMRDSRRDFPQPQWRGEAAPGKTLLIHAEQGFGDTLQFCRYATLAAARGLRVILEVPDPLVRLLRGLPGVADILARGHPLPPFDLHCPMVSMPLAFATTLETIPSTPKYLQADTAQTEAWARRFAASGNGLRVGLAWAGNPRPHSAELSAIDRRRSLNPALLAPLFTVPGATFFSLQKDGPAPPADFPLIDVMDEMRDFADTAALIETLDLVISVDTAIVHLAAALGKPVWVLERFDSCWRWLNGRRDSPWYPSIRLYRQKLPGDWDSVLTEVRGALRDAARESVR
jgi:tetratricopeptide (TPR) repeat protein